MVLPSILSRLLSVLERKLTEVLVEIKYMLRSCAKTQGTMCWLACIFKMHISWKAKQHYTARAHVDVRGSASQGRYWPCVSGNYSTG